uniref:C-type lectin domain-containing protein n=1 Tax=Lepisosteus oculatus TaxID=7918 RepID=W5MJ58_LEPOC
VLQVTNRFQTQNLSLKKNCSQMSKKYKKLNNTYNEMFQKYPVLMKYCPVRDMTSNVAERDCQPCPERWVSFKEKCYFYSSDRLDWTASEHQCMAQGGHLVIVETEEEQASQAFLWEKANRRSQGDSYWIGLTGLKGNDGDWLWVDNTPLKKGQFCKYWGQRVSNSWNENNKETSSTELCVRMTPSLKYRTLWYKSVCKNLFKRICEKPAAIGS